MRVLLSIDPAEKAGAALFVDGALVGHCDFNGSTFTTSHAALAELCKDLPPEVEQATCVIEEGYIGFNTGPGALTLARRRGLAQAAAEALGFTDFAFVAPRTWQPAILGYVPKGQTKPASIAKALETFGIVVSADVADSLNLGTYFIKYALTAGHRSSKMESNGKRRPKKFTTKAQQPEPASGALPKTRRARSRKLGGAGSLGGTK